MFESGLTLPVQVMTELLEVWDNVGSKRIPDFITSNMIDKVKAGGPEPEPEPLPEKPPSSPLWDHLIAKKEAESAIAADELPASAPDPLAAATAADTGAEAVEPPMGDADSTPSATSELAGSVEAMPIVQSLHIIEGFVDIDPKSPFALAGPKDLSPFAPAAQRSPFLAVVDDSRSDVGKRLTKTAAEQPPSPSMTTQQAPSPFAAAATAPSPFAAASPFGSPSQAPSPFAAAAGGTAPSPFAASPFATADASQAPSPFATSDASAASPFAASTTPFTGFAMPGADGASPFGLPMADPTAANMPGALQGSMMSDAPGEDKRFTCAHCGRAFKSEIGLASHCETKHGIKYEIKAGDGKENKQGKQSIPDLPAYVPTPVDMSATAPFGSDKQKGEVTEWSDIEMFPHAHAFTNITVIGQVKSITKKTKNALEFSLRVVDDEGVEEVIPVSARGGQCALLQGAAEGTTLLVKGMLRLHPTHDDKQCKYYYDPKVHVDAFAGSLCEL